MRIDIKKTKVYPYEELSDEAKQKAIESFAEINVNYEWWGCVFEDAEQVGIILTEFNIGRGSCCRGDFILDAEDVANAIVEQHGESCETYKTATEFLAKYEEWMKLDEGADEDGEHIDTTAIEDLEGEFEYSILEDYRIILQKEYEYLTSDKAIVETIEINEYEFTEDGRLYH